MAPKKPPAPPPPPPPDEEEIDLFQNPIKKVPVKYLWLIIAALTIVCLIILTITIKTYNALLLQDWTPYDEPIKKLRTTLSIGLRNRNVMYYQNPQKVSDIVENIPKHLKESEEVYLEEKKKYQALYKKGVRFGSDWRLFGWNFYYVSKANEKRTWHDAEYFCKSRDSHLISILNEEEQKFISSKLNESAWIGLTDENVEGHWAWSDGSRLIIQYWADDNPNGSVSGGEADEDCVALKPSGSDLNWIDASCQELKRWVCKENIEFENTYSSSTMLTEAGLNVKKNENDDF